MIYKMITFILQVVNIHEYMLIEIITMSGKCFGSTSAPSQIDCFTKQQLINKDFARCEFSFYSRHHLCKV